MKKSNGIAPQFNDALKELGSVPARGLKAAARGRANFLAEAASIRAAQGQRVKSRVIQTRRFALNAFASAVVILVVFFGGSVGVAFAAQATLPGNTLYPVKLWSEDMRLSLVSDPDTGIDLLLQFVQSRVIEMNALTVQGSLPSAETMERTEQQLRAALELTAGLDDEPMQIALLRIRTQLETQTRSLVSGTPEQIRTLFRAQLQCVDDGLADPAVFRDTIRNQQQAGRTPAAQSTPSPGAPTTAGGSGAGGTPTPGAGQSPTTGPHDPQVTPGPTQGSGGSGNAGQGGKP